MERIRSYYDADRTEGKNVPTPYRTGENKNQVFCSVCGEKVFVDDLTFKDINRIIEKTMDNPFLCRDCVEEYEEAAHQH